ncbi:MAG TPA: hypothetical protein VNH80_07150 [Burkholderiales bacterium]|nr:hypothetical protein [Burkholderiales bacterium]
MKAARWVGFALVALALIGLPVAIWISERWGLIFATLGTLGLVVLGLFAKQKDGAKPD